MPKKDHRKELTDTMIRKLPAAPEGSRYQRMDSVVPGFGVRVTDNGTKSFILRTRYPGGGATASRREIGRVGVMSLADARDKARGWQALIAKGIDPSLEEEKQRAAETEKRANTFGAVAEDFIAEKLPSERSRVDVERDIRRELLPKWSKFPISEISDAMVVSLVKTKARDGKVAARNLLALIRRMFRWAIAQRVYGLKSSPADGIRATDIIGEVVSVSARVLDNAELRALWQSAGEIGYPVGAIYRLLALTALRLREVSEAEWAEIDFDRGVWTIPAERMKGKDAGKRKAKAHEVPLTGEIRAILEAVPRFEKPKGDFIFSTTSGARPVWIGGKVKDDIDARMLKKLGSTEFASNWTNHDIRRTVRSHLSALRISENAREAVLAHVRPGIVGVYDQHSYFAEKSEALTLWAARLQSIVAPRKAKILAMKAPA